MLLSRAQKLVACARAERARWGLWTPVVLGGGIWLYFALPWEPALGWLILSPALGLAFGWFAARRGWLLPLFLLALGFNAAQFSTWRAMTPLLATPVFVPELQGRLVSLLPAKQGATLLLDELNAAALPASQMPRMVRLRLRDMGQSAPAVGSRVALAAALMPISAPVQPEAFDFRRQSFFTGVGAQGFGRGEVRVIASPPALGGLLLWVEGLRQEIAVRVAQQLRGDTAQIAVALLNGAQSGISEPTLQSMRGAGLFHILSISGLHLAIVAAFMFVGFRRLLALSPWLALHWPIKKIAAALALALLPFYTLLVGEPVPAVRSALMTGLVMLAVLVERRALSLRTVALAASVLLLVVPEALLGASFQLSFAAVTVMIAGYEALRRYRQPRLDKAKELGAWVQTAHTLWRYGAGMALTSLLASLATAPFTLFQFQQLNGYGIFANMLGIPLTSFIIMPAGFIAYLLMPFGLEGGALALMGWGIDGLMALAARVGNWPGATLAVSAFPGSAFALMLAGGLWLCLWQERWRFLGLLPLAGGVLWAGLAPRPDILIAPEFANWAVRYDAQSWLADRASDRDFTIKQWIQRSGDADFYDRQDWPTDDETLRCDALGCHYQAQGKRVAFVFDAAALAEDCGNVDIIITPLWHVPCTSVPVVDGARLKWQGATSVTLRPNAPPLIESSRARWGARPWSPGWRG